MSSQEVELATLRAGLDKAHTPAELTAVLDMADAMQDRARRFRVAFANANMLDAARDAYRIGIQAAFARLEAVCRIADELPDGPGRPEKMSDDLTISDWGISRDDQWAPACLAGDVRTLRILESGKR